MWRATLVVVIYWRDRASKSFHSIEMLTQTSSEMSLKICWPKIPKGNRSEEYLENSGLQNEWKENLQEEI